MSLIKRNIVANFGGKAWSALVSLVAVPIYLSFLGTEAYGLVGIYASMTGVLTVLDLGLSTVLSREMARLAGAENATQSRRRITRALELAYWAVAIMIGVGIWGLAPFLASRWVNAVALPVTTVETALMLAGMLSDDTPMGGGLGGLKKDGGVTPARSVSSKAEEKEKEKEKPKDPVDQKIPLLRHLLAMGALPEAMFILGKYDWICGPEFEVADHIHRIIHFSIEDIYSACRPGQKAADRVAGIAKQVPESYLTTSPSAASAPSVPQISFLGGKTNLIERPKRKITRTPGVFWSINKTDDVEFRFFWDDWSDGVPKCKAVKDVLLLCKTLLRFTGVRIGRDPGLMAKICRIGKKDIEDAINACNPKRSRSQSTNNDDHNMDENEEATASIDIQDMEARMKHKETTMASWSQVLREILLPAVSVTGANPGVVNEVWSLLTHFPTETRYCMYGEWTNIHCKRNTELRLKASEAEKETKDLLKRISKTNVKQMARSLAKVAMSNPGTVFSAVLTQIEAYDNLVDCVVDAARYFTVLGYDVLVWTICTQLGVGGEGRGGRIGDGMGKRKWLLGKPPIDPNQC